MASSHVMLKHLLLQAKNYILYWYNKKMLTINSSSIKFVQLVQSKPALCFKPFRPSIVMKSEPNKYSSSKLKSTHQPSCHSPPTIQQLYVRYCPPRLMCVPTVPKVGKNEFYNFHHVFNNWYWFISTQLFHSRAQFSHFCRNTPEENDNNTCLASYLFLSSSTL